MTPGARPGDRCEIDGTVAHRLFARWAKLEISGSSNNILTEVPHILVGDVDRVTYEYIPTVALLIRTYIDGVAQPGHTVAAFPARGQFDQVLGRPTGPIIITHKGGHADVVYTMGSSSDVPA